MSTLGEGDLGLGASWEDMPGNYENSTSLVGSEGCGGHATGPGLAWAVPSDSLCHRSWKWHIPRWLVFTRARVRCVSRFM